MAITVTSKLVCVSSEGDPTSEQALQAVSRESDLTIPTAAKVVSYVQAVQPIGTSPEAIGKGDLVNLGWAWFHNVSGASHISLRMGSTGADFVRLREGEATLLRLASNIPYATASAASGLLEYLLLEAES